MKIWNFNKLQLYASISMRTAVKFTMSDTVVILSKSSSVKFNFNSSSILMTISTLSSESAPKSPIMRDSSLTCKEKKKKFVALYDNLVLTSSSLMPRFSESICWITFSMSLRVFTCAICERFLISTKIIMTFLLHSRTPFLPFPI